MLTAFKDLKTGVNGYWAGVAWLRQHPSYFLLLIIPYFLSWSIVGASAFYLLPNIGPWVLSWLPPISENFLLKIIYGALLAVTFALVVILTLTLGMVLAAILSSPFMELVSMGVEKKFTGHVEEVSFAQFPRVLWEELKKTFFIMTMSLAVTVIPGMNIIGIAITAFLIGWQWYDYPLARRGWSFSKRLSFVWEDKWAVLGLGVWLVIPVLNLFLMPMAVVGGTMLCLRQLKE